MTMEMANVLLKNLRDIKTTQSHKKPAPPSSSTSSVSTLPQYQPPTPERPPVPQYQSQQQQQQVPSAPQHLQAQPQQQRPQPPSRPSFDGARPAQTQTQAPQLPPVQVSQPMQPPHVQPYGQQQQPVYPGQQSQQQGYDRPASGPRPMPPVPTQQQRASSEYVPPVSPVQQQQAQQQRPQQPPYASMPPIAPPQQQSRPEPQRVQSGYVPPPPPQTQIATPPQQYAPSAVAGAGTIAVSNAGAGAATAPVRRKRKVGLDDFNFLAVLGKGNFGKVMLAEEKASSSLYAIKVLKKEFIIENDEIESTQSEKRVFQSATQERHPFLLGLHSCFQTETRVYFVMEYVSGGDLMLHIQKKQFTLRQAKFYACEVLLALQYFHSKGIIYRDLKLDNILLGLDGHVRVADYGLCKEEMWYGNTTSTFCGTPEFMAPEVSPFWTAHAAARDMTDFQILLEQRYGRAVDWWAFGVLTYEMLLGQSPFKGDDEDEIFDAILEDEPLYPITMPRDAVSLLQRVSPPLISPARYILIV